MVSDTLNGLYLMLVLVFRMLRYCRMSGNVISLRARKNLRPIHVLKKCLVRNDKYVHYSTYRGRLSHVRITGKMTIMSRLFECCNIIRLAEGQHLCWLGMNWCCNWLHYYNNPFSERIPVLPVQVNGHKWWGNGEVINKGVKLQHKPDLVRCRDELGEKRIKCQYRAIFVIK